MIINLISGPRNVSTALMYSFAQRSDTTVIDEPFYGYYLKTTGIIHPGKKRIINSMETDISVITQNLMNQNHGAHIIFLKNMAHHHIQIDDKFLLHVKNVFLIRNPAELLVSFSKVIKNPSIEDIGLKKSWELFHTLLDADQDPVILDSGELLKNPGIMLERLCKSINISYDPKMQSWPAGPRKEDGIWADYWYHNVHKSTGFIKSEPKKIKVPESMLEVWKEAIKYYKELYDYSIKND
jgi:hypothetical protein